MSVLHSNPPGFPILCSLPAWLTLCIPMIILLFYAWSAVSASRIVEDKSKETVCYCRGDRNPEFLSSWHSDSHMLGTDICVEICRGWMNPEPSEPPKGCSASVQRMDSMADLYSNATCTEALPIQQDFGGVYMVVCLFSLHYPVNNLF